MLFRFLILVHVCTAFPLKCPAPAHWSLRARSHCPDPSKYFCLKNDLINGYTENCTVFDFLQPGRKSVLRGGLDADICSFERFQPWPINFYTNVSTNCIFLKSTCNEEGQLIYGKGNRNIDTSCRCDYTRGYNFLYKPRNSCFCVPSKEDCSCYLKKCPKSTDMLSSDYECIHLEKNKTVSECKPIIYERVITSGEKKTSDFSTRRELISNNVQTKITLTGICIGLMFLFSMVVLTDELLDRYFREVYFLYTPPCHKTIIEGDCFELEYKLSTNRYPTTFYKNGEFIPETTNVAKRIAGRWRTLAVDGATTDDAGDYCLGVKTKTSEYVQLRVQRMFTANIGPQECIEGDTIELICSVYADNIEVQWYKEEDELKCKKYVITRRENKRILTIADSTVSDSGTYFVKAGNAQMKIPIKVKGILRKQLENVTIMEGLETMLECETEEENYHVQWFKNDVDISDRIKIQGRIHSLSILKAETVDNGTYSIKIKSKTNTKIEFKSEAVLSVKEMPSTIKQMPIKEREEFLKATRSGTTKRYYIRVMIVGENGVGKTSLLRRLMKENTTNVETTDGIKIERSKCQINIHTGEWKLCPENPSSSDDSEEFADCGFWDFAGQKIFYATHQTFLSANAVYVLVVDIAKDFSFNTYNNMIENEFNNVGEYIDFWLDSIHCYSLDDKHKSIQYNANTLINPPVIIVGTGIDKIKPSFEDYIDGDDEHDEKQREIQLRTQEFQNYLDKNLNVHEKRRHLRTTHFLSNECPSEYEEEFEKLRKQILVEAKDSEGWGNSLPTRWIVLEKEMFTLVDQVISYDEAIKLAADCSFPDVKQTCSELDSFLMYEHNIGNIIFFKDLNDYIILKQEWLVDVFRCFVSHKYKPELIGMTEWTHLKETGILKDNLVNELLKKIKILTKTEHKRFVLKLMEKFNIIAKPLNDNAKGDYYMPCMIKALQIKSIFETPLEGISNWIKTSWFCLQFQFLPPSYFNHILVDFMKRYKLFNESKGTTKSIYRNFGKFLLNEKDSEILFICLSQNLVAMQVQALKKCCELGCYSDIKNKLIKLIDSVQLRYRIKVTYEKRFKCKDVPFYENRGIGYDEAMKINEYHCVDHCKIRHPSKEMYRYWMAEDEVEKERKKKGCRKCNICENMSVFKCCNQDLCEDCSKKHKNENFYKGHAMQLISDSFTLHSKFSLEKDKEGERPISDIQCLPNGELIIADYRKNEVMTFSISGKRTRVIQLDDNPRAMVVVDKHNVAVLLSNNSVAIVDYTQICVQNLRSSAISRSVGSFVYIEKKFYLSDTSGIAVIGMSGDLKKPVELSFSPEDMCYDGDLQRIYCIDKASSKLICIDKDGNNKFIFADPNWTNLNRVTIDNKGNVLVLCIQGNDEVQCVIMVDSHGKLSELVITNIEVPSFFSCICFHHSTDSVVIGVDEKVYIYKKEAKV